MGTVRIVDQIKRYAPDHIVTLEQVHGMLGVLLAEQNATKGFITTTSRPIQAGWNRLGSIREPRSAQTFAPKLMEAPGLRDLIPNRLELRDGKTLLEWLKSIADGPDATKAS